VVRLRQKLETDSTMPRHFVTVHGVGYRFLL
jgi:DNA-binding response OmpR family regulator